MDDYSVDDAFDLVADPQRPGIVSHEQLETYSRAFQLASDVFEISKGFPTEERYSLTDQIRRSSRSVCANLAEGWRKRRYRAAFQNSLNHAEAEAAETQTWIRFAENSGYIEKEQADQITSAYDEVIRMLVKMITNPDPWLLPPIR